MIRKTAEFLEVASDEIYKVKSRLLVPTAGSKGSLLKRMLRNDRIPVSKVPAPTLAAEFKPSDNGGPCVRSDPGTILGSDWANGYMDLIKNLTFVEPQAGVARIRDAIVCGEGLVAKETSDGMAVLPETLRNGTYHRSILPFYRDDNGSLFLSRPLRPRKTISQPSILMRQIWDSNYGHWIIECLPWIGIVAEHYDLSTLQVLVSRGSKGMQSVYEQTLGTFGIKPEQIVYMFRQPVLVKDLIFPMPLTNQRPWIFAPRAVKILEDLGKRIAGDAEAPKRIYISRHGATQRHLLNEADVLQALEPYGFTTIYLNGLSFVDQIRAFSGAEFIVGNYGANLTNAVFSARGQTMFALTSERMMDDFYWAQTNMKGGRYISLHGKAADKNPDLNSDFTIDIAAFKAKLAELLGPA